MITANQWYNVAVTGNAGTRTGIRIEFDDYYALFAVAVDYGNSVITAVESNISPDTITVGARIRYSNGYWYVDVRLSVSYKEKTLDAYLYENSGWAPIETATAGSGSTLCVINDLVSLINLSNGDSLFEMINAGSDEKPVYAVVPKEFRQQRPGILSRTFVVAGGAPDDIDADNVSGGSLADLSDVEDTASDLFEEDMLLVKLKDATHWTVKSLKEVTINEEKLKEYLLWEKVNVGTEESPVWAVVPLDHEGNPVGIVSDTFITAGGRNGNSSGQGSATTLGGLANVDDTADNVLTEDVVLFKGINATHWTLRALSTLGINEEKLQTYLETNKYVTQTFLTDNKYLTKQAADELYMPISEILWERVNVGTEDNPQWAVIPVDYNGNPVGIVSDTFITSGGRKGSSGTGSSFNRLDSWDNYNPNAGDVLSAVLGYELKTRLDNLNVGLDESKLKEYLDTNEYITKTAGNELYAPLASFNELNTKINDFLTGSDTNNIIDKWKELEAFLAGQTETSTLADLLIEKADKTALEAVTTRVTTVEGYFNGAAAKNALKLGGQLPEYYATASALSTHISTYNTFVNNTYAAHIAEYNTHVTTFNNYKSATDKRLADLEALWAIDEDNNGLYPKSGRGIWSESYITAGGIGTSAGAGGLIQNVYGFNSLGGTFDNTVLTDTFNAYTINYLYTEVEKLKSGDTGFSESAMWTALGGSAENKVIASEHIPNLDWSKITSGKPTTLAGYGITDKVAYRERQNNFIHNGNEFTFASPAYSSLIWINYRTASGDTDGAITEYCFAKGAGPSYANIRAAKYIVNGGTSSQFLKADGSSDSTAYLPLSGETMKNNAGISWTYDVHSWDAPVNGLECITTSNSTLGYYSGLSYKGYYGLQIRAYGGNTDLIQVRGFDHANWGTWRGVIHSGNIGSYNAGSATKLQTPRTIWGQSFDGAGDIDGAFKYGYINLEAGNEINSKDTNGTGVTLRLNWQGAGDVIIGYGGGNVGVGNPSPAYKLDVTGRGRFSEGINLSTTGNPTAYNEYGIMFGSYARMGVNTTADFGIYAKNIIYIRPGCNGAPSTYGLIVSSTGLDVIGALNATTIYQNGQTLNKYYLPLSGGLMEGAATIQWNDNLCGWDAVSNGLIGMSVFKGDANFGYYSGLSFKGYYGFQIRSYGGADIYQVRRHNSATWGSWLDIIHSGNIGSYNAGSAYKIIDSSGNVKVWVSSAGYLQVAGVQITNDVIERNASSASPIYLQWTNRGNTIINGQGGNVLIGTTTDAGYKLYVNGTLSAGATTVASLTSNGNISATGSTILGYTGRFFDVMPRTDGSSGVYNLGSSDNRWTAYLKSADITGNIRLKPTSANYGNYLYFGDGSYCYIAELTDDKMTIYASSGLQITANTDVSGNIYATGAITAGSDARYKSKLQDVAVDVEVIAGAPLFDFVWNDGRKDTKTYLGTTAQYWAQTNFKNAVIPTTDEKLWTMSYSQIAMGNTIVLARELLPIKRKVSEIDNLKNRLHKAERKIEILEQELNQYRRA